MSDITRYYLLDSGRNATNSATDDWDARAKAEYYCACGQLLTLTTVEVDLEERPVGCAVNSVSMTGVGILHNDLLRELGRAQFQSLFITGPVSIRGHRLNSHTAYVAREGCAVTIRGEKCSIFRFCDECRRPAYVGLGKKRLLQGDIPETDALYPTRRSPIVLREDLSDRIRSSGVKGLHLTRLVVVNSPLDGLPPDLSCAPKDLRLNFTENA